MLLHLLVLAPFVAAILMVMTSKEDSKSSSRLNKEFKTKFSATAPLNSLNNSPLFTTTSRVTDLPPGWCSSPVAFLSWL